MSAFLRGGRRGLGSCCSRVSGVLYDPGEREVGVFGGLRQAAGEVVEAIREPRIMLTAGGPYANDQFFREEFSQRGCLRLRDASARRNEINVSLHGVARSRARMPFAPLNALPPRRTPVAFGQRRSHFSMPPGPWCRRHRDRGYVLRQARRKGGIFRCAQESRRL